VVGVSLKLKDLGRNGFVISSALGTIYGKD
jgi:hypothetical protein